MSENIAQEIILEKDAFEDTVLEPTQITQDTQPAAQEGETVAATQLENIKKNRPDLVEIGDALDGIQINEALVQIAKTNQLDMSWEQLQRILDSLINEQCTVMEDKFQDEGAKKLVEALSTKITHAINDHSNCPFTIQRLCELIIEPKKYYKMYIKYLRAVEKVLSVTSYWEDYANKSTMDTTQEGEPAIQLIPSFSVELVPHNFTESNVMKDEEAKADEKDEQGQEEPNTAAESATENQEGDDLMKNVSKEGKEREDNTMDDATKEEQEEKKDQESIEAATKEEETQQDDMEDVTKEDTVVEQVKKDEKDSESKKSVEEKKEEDKETEADTKMDLD